jgi:hypothetical protein
MREGRTQNIPSSGTAKLEIIVNRLREVWRVVSSAEATHVHCRMVTASLVGLTGPRNLKVHEWSSDLATRHRLVLQTAVNCARDFIAYLIQPARRLISRVTLPPLPPQALQICQACPNSRQRQRVQRDLESGVFPRQLLGNAMEAPVELLALRQHHVSALAGLTSPISLRPLLHSVHREVHVSPPQLGLREEVRNLKLSSPSPAAPVGQHLLQLPQLQPNRTRRLRLLAV